MKGEVGHETEMAERVSCVVALDEKKGQIVRGEKSDLEFASLFKALLTLSWEMFQKYIVILK